MHLSECVDLFSESNSFDREVGECIHNWLWKTRTEFFEHNGLILTPYFGALCWTYSLAGIVMLIIKPKCNWWVQSSFPYVTYALVLVFIQGPLSFYADYVNMTNESLIHVVDRFMATFMISLYAWKMTAIFYYGRPSFFIAQLCAVTFALFSFMNSQDAQEMRDSSGFIFWHNLWHVFPLNVIIIEIFDIYILREASIQPSTESCGGKNAINLSKKMLSKK